MQIENENNFRAATRAGINLFLGAGFSLLASNAEGKTLPLGNALAAELNSRFNLNFGSALNLSQLCTIIESSDKRGLRQFLEHRFRVVSFDPRYKNLDRLQLESIFTTNIDDLIFRIFEDSPEHYVSDLDITGPAFRDRDAIDVVHLHGCVNNPKKSLRFGTAELAAAFGADPDRWHVLTHALQKHPTLFWGYSIADEGALRALSTETIGGRQHKDRWILLHPDFAEAATQSYFKALGFQISIGTTEEMLIYLGALEVEAPQSKRSNRATKHLFPGAAIPPTGTTPVRAVVEFFLGAPPVWSDIYSGVIHKTSWFNRIRDAINSRKHVIIIGVPACGKTTLLMQLAAAINYDGHSIIFDSITDERARHITARLEGERALVFLDNCCDSIDALQYLAKSNNVQIIGADRDYNFGFVSHRLHIDGFAVIDVTELTPADIQGCLNCIPQGLASAKYRVPDRNSLTQPSLFEIIEANILKATLRERFRQVLHQLKTTKPTHHDVLLMMSYVQLCRVPVSMDMLIAFLRDKTQDWQEVAEIRDELGAMIADYVGGLTAHELDQDYFVPRSTLVGETIVDVADDASLKRVLIKFHTELSPYRICRYDVFRRHAYDADLFVRAFPRWEEGKQFYEQLYARDLSPFMLQQSALYLSRKKQHAEAFSMIDRAIIESGGRQLTIRNSHAIIMFRANIGYVDDPIARQSLRDSMQTLTECYKWDKRRLFHAVTFSAQALDYFRLVDDDVTRGYLVTAKKWLEEELKSTPWSWRIKQLLPQIRQIVG